MASRKKCNLLEKPPLPSILGARLPSKEQVLLHLLYHIEEGKALSKATTATMDEVKKIWERASLPTMTDANLRKKIKKLYAEYKKLIKEKNRETDGALLRRETWLGDLQDLFDIAAANIFDLKIPEEDIEFLRCQREDRMSCSFGCVDKVQQGKDKRKRAREAERNARAEHSAETMAKQKCIRGTHTLSRLREEVGQDSSTASEDGSDEEFAYRATPAKPSHISHAGLKKRGSSEVLVASLTTTWDREGLSNRQAAASFIVTAKSLGHDVSNYSVSSATVHRARSKNRAKVASQWESEAFRDPPLLVLHWDGKLLPQATCQRNHEDRIAVIASGVDFEELLGVPVAADGSGKEVADMVVKQVRRLALEDKIIGMSFDTTASNSGMLSGACMRLQNELGKDLLWLACRHHVYELVLKHSFEAACGPSSGPDIPIFKKFQAEWDQINKTDYTTLNLDSMDKYFQGRHAIVVPFLKRAITAKHPREDYAELLNLCLLYLGGFEKSEPEGNQDAQGLAVDTEFHFRAPGAYHQARWMAKAIYCVKITLFEAHTRLTLKQKRSVRKVTNFVCFIYIMYWHESSLATHAPKNDLDLIQSLHLYPDKTIADAALNSIGRHLWYLSEDLVALAFFDARIDAEEKETMLRNLERRPGKMLKRLDAKSFLRKSSTATISSLVTRRSIHFFEVLTEGQIDGRSNPDDVRSILTDENLRQKVHSLKVINDSAERGIALIKRCQQSVRNEDQKQFLLRVVQGHRDKVSKRTKSSYSEYSV